jgi:hypothetical protein
MKISNKTITKIMNQKNQTRKQNFINTNPNFFYSGRKNSFNITKKNIKKQFNLRNKTLKNFKTI